MAPPLRVTLDQAAHDELERRYQTAVRKPIPRVLVRAARSLYHAVKRHPIHHDYLSHLSCPFALGSATQRRCLGIPETRVIPASHPPTRTRMAEIDIATKHRTRRQLHERRAGNRREFLAEPVKPRETPRVGRGLLGGRVDPHRGRQLGWLRHGAYEAFGMSSVGGGENRGALFTDARG